MVTVPVITSAVAVNEYEVFEVYHLFRAAEGVYPDRDSTSPASSVRLNCRSKVVPFSMTMFRFIEILASPYFV